MAQQSRAAVMMTPKDNSATRFIVSIDVAPTSRKWIDGGNSLQDTETTPLIYSAPSAAVAPPAYEGCNLQPNPTPALPKVKPVNQVGISRDAHVSETFMIDPSLRVSSSLLAPLERDEERKNLKVVSKFWGVDVSIYLLDSGKPVEGASGSSVNTQASISSSRTTMYVQAGQAANVQLVRACAPYKFQRSAFLIMICNSAAAEPWKRRTTSLLPPRISGAVCHCVYSAGFPGSVNGFVEVTRQDIGRSSKSHSAFQRIRSSPKVFRWGPIGVKSP